MPTKIAQSLQEKHLVVKVDSSKMGHCFHVEIHKLFGLPGVNAEVTTITWFYLKQKQQNKEKQIKPIKPKHPAKIQTVLMLSILFTCTFLLGKSTKWL